MVDLFGMFRRRPAKRSPPGFARTRPDITSLEDAMDSLTNPVRDAPRTARDGVRDPAPPRPETRQETRQAEKPRPRARTNGAAAPRQTPRAGYLAVHSVEKSFGTRQVVRGVSIYVRRGEAVGLLGPNGAGKTTVFYMITGLIKADRRAQQEKARGRAQFAARRVQHHATAQNAVDCAVGRRAAARRNRAGPCDPPQLHAARRTVRRYRSDRGG